MAREGSKPTTRSEHAVLTASRRCPGIRANTAAGTINEKLRRPSGLQQGRKKGEGGVEPTTWSSPVPLPSPRRGPQSRERLTGLRLTRIAASRQGRGQRYGRSCDRFSSLRNNVCLPLHALNNSFVMTDSLSLHSPLPLRRLYAHSGAGSMPSRGGSTETTG